MITVHMGLNTTPAWVNEEEVVARWEARNKPERAAAWREEAKYAKQLRNQIEDFVEQYGEVALNWSCTGENMFNMLAHQWSRAMPEYHFEIGRYRCIVTK